MPCACPASQGTVVRRFLASTNKIIYMALIFFFFFLRCEAVESDISVPTFRRNVVPHVKFLTTTLFSVLGCTVFKNRLMWYII